MSASTDSPIESLNKEFNNTFLRVVDSSLMQLGENVESIVYYYLERDYVKRRDIPTETERFSACLEKIFGKAGEHVMRMMIVERLYVEIEEELEEVEDYSFSDYVDDARKRYLQKNRGLL